MEVQDQESTDRKESSELSPCDPCYCVDKNYKGKPCECFTMKEDLRLLFGIGEFLDVICTNQQKALAAPLNDYALYNLFEGVYNLNQKSKICKCGTEDEEDSDLSLNFEEKDYPAYCFCPSVYRNRSILRIVRNEIYRRIQIIKRNHFLLTNKNKKFIKFRKEKKNVPVECVTEKINYCEKKHNLVKRCMILDLMGEPDVPIECLYDTKKLMEHIGEHRILPKQLRDILAIEDLIDEVDQRGTKKGVSSKKKGNRSDKNKEKLMCKCKENEAKIKVLEEFLTMVASLHPIVQEAEEPLSLSESEKEHDTLSELLLERKKERDNTLYEIAMKNREKADKILDKCEKLEEKNLIQELINSFEIFLLLMDIEMENYPDCKNLPAGWLPLIEDASVLLELIPMLKKYLNSEKENMKPEDKKMLLKEINLILEELIFQQKLYLSQMEEAFPGFNTAIFLKKREVDKEVDRIFKNEGMNLKAHELAREGVEDFEPKKKRFRQLIKEITKPENIKNRHLYSIDKEARKNTQYSLMFELKKFQKKVIKRLKARKENVEQSEIIKEIIEKLENKNADEKPEGKTNKTYEPKNDVLWDTVPISLLAERIVKYLLNRNDRPECPKSRCKVKEKKEKHCLERTYVKKVCKAFKEGKRIAYAPDDLLTRKQENIMVKKRLLYELELEKGFTKCKCVVKQKRDMKMKLKQLYETKYSDVCKCVRSTKKLNKLEKYIENIFLHPENYKIVFETDPEGTNPCMTKEKLLAEMKKKLDKFPAKIKKERIGSSFLTDLQTRDLKVVYDDKRFKKVWDHYRLTGIFHLNLEAQMMEYERIIIRPQYEKRVKVMSAGRLGLEPLYGEYVCNGMLDGVVLGDMISGPIPRTILQAILELDSGQGVVIIIFNELGDRLNCNFAIERARQLGVEAELILARDDIGEDQPDEKKYGRRGHAGIILQYKIAAGMAMKGLCLKAISRVTQNIQVSTLGVHFYENEICVGCGALEGRGECWPGVGSQDVVKGIIQMMINPGEKYSIGVEPGSNIIILVNHFDLSSDAIYSIIEFTVRSICDAGAKASRIYQGSYFAFPRDGFSLTLAKDWNDELIQYLDLPTSCNHWPPHLSGAEDNSTQLSKMHEEHPVGAFLAPENVSIMEEILKKILSDLNGSIKKIQDLSKDFGILISNVLEKLGPLVGNFGCERPLLVLKLIGDLMTEPPTWHGQFICLLIFTASQVFLKDPDFIVNWRHWCVALRRATQSLAGYTKLKTDGRKFLDYLKPLSDTMGSIKKGWSPLPFFHEVLEKLEEVVKENTQDVLIIVFDIIFKNIYTTLNKYFSCYTGKDWWIERPFPKIMLVNPDTTEKVCVDRIPEKLKKKINELEKIPLFKEEDKNLSLYVPDPHSYPSIEALSCETLEEGHESLSRSETTIISQEEDFYEDESET